VPADDQDGIEFVSSAQKGVSLVFQHAFAHMWQLWLERVH